MIPKIIHYCWFGGGRIPESQRKCIASWKKLMPEYQIQRWDESNFDYKKFDFSRDAYEIGKYAFVSDMCRLEVLSTYGGFYFDTDVELFCSLDKYSNYDFVSGLEIFPEFERYKHLLDKEGKPLNTQEVFSGGCGILAAVIGVIPNNPIIRETLEYYRKRTLYQDGKIQEFPIPDGYLANMAVKYGFRYYDGDQIIGKGIEWQGKIINSSVFLCYEQPRPNSAELIHHAAQSWKTKTKKQLFEIELDKKGLLKYYNYIKHLKHKLLNK